MVSAHSASSAVILKSTLSIVTDLDRTAALLTVFLLAGCVSDLTVPASEEARNPSSIPPDANDEHDWFADQADAAGLHFVHFNGMSGQFYFPEIMPPGVGSGR